MTTVASSGKGSVASAAGLSPHTLGQADRDVVARALGRYGKQERALTQALIVERPKPKKNARKRERLIPRVLHCLYCGHVAKQSGVCPGHSDLPDRDPFFASLLARAPKEVPE